MYNKEDVIFDFTNMMSDSMNSSEKGISKIEIEKYKPKMEKAFDEVIVNSSKEANAYFDLVRQPKDLEEIEKFADDIASKFDDFVVLGIGGSALGARALFAGLSDIHHNRKVEERKKRPRIFIRDSIDPEKFKGLLEIVNLKKAMFCVVTKSGGTTETMLQLSVAIEEVKKEVGSDFSNNFCVITSNKESNLNRWAISKNIKTFYFSENLSGRFSVLSAVGILPAFVAGLDVRKILDGGKYMLEKCSSVEDNPALFSATLQKIAMDKGANISYLMPYSDSLRVFAEWYCQLWAESLGKCIKVGENVGQTPVRAFGTVDQHSQMQLCLEGPFDKVITFVKVLEFSKDLVIPKNDFNLVPEYMQEKKMSEILIASQEATAKALLERERMNQTIIVNKVDEFVMGELLMYFMLQTSFVGALLQINTYNQPSVELIKQNIKKSFQEEI